MGIGDAVVMVAAMEAKVKILYSNLLILHLSELDTAAIDIVKLFGKQMWKLAEFHFQFFDLVQLILLWEICEIRWKDMQIQ